MSCTGQLGTYQPGVKQAVLNVCYVACCSQEERTSETVRAPGLSSPDVSPLAEQCLFEFAKVQGLNVRSHPVQKYPDSLVIVVARHLPVEVMSQLHGRWPTF